MYLIFKEGESLWRMQPYLQTKITSERVVPDGLVE